MTDTEHKSWFGEVVRTVLTIIAIWAVMALAKTILLEGGSWQWLWFLM
jgi:hypothetical protein